MRFVTILAFTFTSLFFPAEAAATQELAKAGGCLSCHAIDKKKLGPSFKEVAAKYKGKPGAEVTLIKVLSEAKVHPEHKSKDGDLAAVIKWVLAQ